METDMKRVIKANRESGLASFMVTTILIMVITLIIIGFSQVARRNQQETLDRQLNNQAFYAAESGVNAAIAVLQDKISASQEPPEKTTCDDFSNYPDVTPDAPNVEVTCMLVETDLANLFYDTVNESAPTVAPLVPADPALRIGKLTFTWRNSTTGANASQTCTAASSPNFNLPTRGSWTCGHGLLRVDVSPQPTGQPNTAFTGFFHPHRVTSTLDPVAAPASDYAAGGGLSIAHCSDNDNDPKCMASVDGLDAAAYYVNLRSIYRNSAVTINGYDTNGNPMRFKGQVSIDVTAKAQDVIKRIQVRVPLKPQDTSAIPSYAIESSDSLCKRYSSFPGDDYDDIVCP